MTDKINLQNNAGRDASLVIIEARDISIISKHLPACGQSIPVESAITQPLENLRVFTSIADVAHTLDPGEAYAIITDHKDVWLGQRDPVTGKYPSLPRGEKGQILEHPQWKRIGVDAVKAVKVIGSQMLLVHMSMQLQKIITRVEHIVGILHDNNVAELEGCVESLMAGIALLISVFFSIHFLKSMLCHEA